MPLPAKGPGRPKGLQNRTTKVLKDAILMAAEAVGEDGKGKDGIQGYLKHIAMNDSKSFARLLGKILPIEIAADAASASPVIVANISLTGPVDSKLEGPVIDAETSQPVG